MTRVERDFETSRDGVVTSAAPDGLAAIYRPDCGAAVWQRRPLPRFQSWIDALAPEQLPQTRLILRPERVCEALQSVVRASGTPAAPERDLLVEDAAALAAIFADVMRAPYLRLRLDVIATNACRKFHIDAVTARLVCTYRGTGTQYGVSVKGAEPFQIQTVDTGAPIVMRGTRWPEAPATPAVAGLRHRSPPIEGSGETRLLLVLDPILDPSEEPETQVLH